jgi:radical SAM family uncharacterized protein
VAKPARYTGGEWNEVRKNPAEVTVRFALALSDVYEVGMSNLGLKILYGILNDRKDTYAERVYCPWPDMESVMREGGAPLCSLETHTPLRDFDAVGFSLQYEMTYSNILTMLDLGGIPLESGSRSDSDPLIVGGGPCAYNPEPLADFFDCFVIGEGEEVIGEMAAAIAAWKKDDRRGGRAALLLMLARLEGIYVPAFYQAEYDAKGAFCQVTPLTDAVPATVTKRVVADLDNAPFPTRSIVPYLETVHDRIMLELFRGCSRGCRFCQAGVVYRPVRERKPETLLRLAQELADNTGYDEISLVSLSSADYSCLRGLTEDLLTRFAPQRVSLSLPSLRVDSFSIELANEIQKVRRSGLTFAPEAGTQRLRDVINKGVTEADLFEAAGAAFRSGWSGIKLYFMIGLPTETDEDLLAIANLARKVLALSRNVRNRKVTVSVSTFVPKAHTPFQWVPQLSIAEMERRQSMLRAALRDRSISFNWHDPQTSRLEGVFARGDRRLGKTLLEAWRRGARFDGWSEYFRPDIWAEAFAATGIDPDFYTVRNRETDEPLPWQHIRCGASHEWLVAEWKRSQSGELTADCRHGECTGCGVCQDLGVAVIDWRVTQ